MGAGVSVCIAQHVSLPDCRRELNRASARRVRTKTQAHMEDMKARLAALEDENESLMECASCLKNERSDLQGQVPSNPRAFILTTYDFWVFKAASSLKHT